MALPLSPPIKPQLALTRKALPDGEEWAYEPKLDGFRAIVFVDGDEVYVQSRGGKPLGRYFPELEWAPGRWVLDGELVIRGGDGEVEFDLLQQRIHPAESRIKLLAEEIPATYIAFDLLAEGDESLLEAPLAERRERLERIAAEAGLELTPLTPDDRAGGALAGQHRGRDGQAARRPLHPRQTQGDGEGEARADDRLRGDGLAAGQRGGHGRLADPRPLRRRRPAHVGHISGFSAAAKRSMRAMLAPLETGEAAPPSRAAGPAAATSSGSSCGPSW